MFKLKNSKYKNTGDTLQAINELLTFYGFESEESFAASINSKKKSLTFKGELKALSATERKIISLTKNFTPKLICSGLESSFQIYSYDNLSKIKGSTCNYCLHVLGEEDSFAEALLIFMTDLLARKVFDKEIMVEVNSLGDKDSALKYLQDFKRFLRRHKKILPDSVLKDFKADDISKALMKLNMAKSPLLDEAPNIMDYLSDTAQKHLYSFLDYLENLGVPYDLNPQLFGNTDIWKHLIINVYVENEDGKKELVAYGGRYDNAAHTLYDKELSLTSLVINIEKKGRKWKIRETARKSSPKVYFVQLGILAKSQGARILEELQDAGFEVGHSLAELSLLEQYKLAMDYSARYAVILGHKEAIDGTVIIRDIETQTQEIIEQKDLIKKLKKLK